ncbi:MAG: hypothetical protein ACYTFD_14830 [Planctomycetota bacterium]
MIPCVGLDELDAPTWIGWYSGDLHQLILGVSAVSSRVTSIS